ncbi:MAG: hypothetical protein AAF384_01645 [Pseudomonadota bacterium]
MLNWRGRKKSSASSIAVHLTSSGVALARVKRSENAPTLTFAEYRKVTASADLPQTLAEICRANDLDDCDCTAVLAIGDYTLVLVERPDVPSDELAEAVRWRIKDLVDFSPDEAAVEVFEVPDLRAGQAMLYAVVARRENIQNTVAMLTDSGFQLDVIDIPEFAIRNIAMQLPEDGAGAAFVYLEQSSGLIVITHQGTLFLSRRFDLGRQRLHASGHTAVSDEIEGLLDSIVIEVQRSLDYYESHFSRPPVSGIVVGPTGGHIEGMDSYLSSQLGIPARQIDYANIIEMEQTPDTDLQAHCLAALGAALRRGEAA